MSAANALERIADDSETFMLPRETTAGRFEVRGSWGTVQPMQLAAGVLTVGELEVIAHLQLGGTVVDTRRARFRQAATIAGTTWVDHDEILAYVPHLATDRPTIFFCNGPQCAATPGAIRSLLESGFPSSLIQYYRGGMHDWMTLGYPTVRG